MLDLIGGSMQSAMSVTFTCVSLIAAAFELICRLRGLRKRPLQQPVEPRHRRRAIARAQRRQRTRPAQPTQSEGLLDRIRCELTG
jgi:hypothetical protein